MTFEHRGCTSRKFGTPRKLLNSSVLLRGESHGRKEVQARKVPPLFWCLTRRKSKDKERLFIPYMKCVLPSPAVHEVLRCVSLPWATSCFGGLTHDVGEEEKDRDTVASGRALEAAPLQSIISTANFGRADFGVRL